MIKLHREGLGILVSLAILFTLANFVAFSFSPHWVISWIVLLMTIVLMGLALNFFRRPRRHNPLADSPGIIVAPADGKLVVVEEVFESEFLQKQCLKVSIFMSIYDVHANWFAVAGQVRQVTHSDGNFLKAFLPKSSTENERSAVLIETTEGHLVLERQIAGAVARRIITYAEVGDTVGVNNFLGFIKFGSRIDLYLPLGSQISVPIGSKVTGNTTVLGHLPQP